MNDRFTIWFTAANGLFVLIELCWVLCARRKTSFRWKDFGANLVMLTGHALLQPLVTVWAFLVFQQAEPLKWLTLPATLWTTLLAFLLVDLCYYAQHRLNHTDRMLWLLHQVHHASTSYNLTTSFRIHWFNGFVRPVYYLPLILLGFDAKQVALALFFNMFYQFFLHTEAVGKLPAVEGWLGTPSAHRVHHGTNPQYIDKNFGGVFMFWDRLFGTYEPERETVRYGIAGKHYGDNPFRHNFFSWRGLKQGKLTRQKPPPITPTDDDE